MSNGTWPTDLNPSSLCEKCGYGWCRCMSQKSSIVNCGSEEDKAALHFLMSLSARLCALRVYLLVISLSGLSLQFLLPRLVFAKKTRVQWHYRRAGIDNICTQCPPTSEVGFHIKNNLGDSRVSLASMCLTLTNATDAHFYANPLLGYRFLSRLVFAKKKWCYKN